LVVLIATMSLAACSPRAEPAAATADTASAPSVDDRLSPAARASLDSGNGAFRARDYSQALRLYRAAARWAPTDGTPLYGIYMVAAKLGDSVLADSAQRMIRRLAMQVRIPAQRASDVPAALNAYLGNPHVLPSH
jgi:Flp pilus assembly protein TadD